MCTHILGERCWQKILGERYLGKGFGETLLVCHAILTHGVIMFCSVRTTWAFGSCDGSHLVQ